MENNYCLLEIIGQRQSRMFLK